MSVVFRISKGYEANEWALISDYILVFLKKTYHIATKMESPTQR